MNDLIELQKTTVLDAFNGDGLDALLDSIRTAATAVEPDLSTAKGRKEIASRARAVSKSKKVIEDAGKGLVSEWKEKAKAIDERRRHSRETLDALRDEVRKPLTDWEAEQDRIEAERIAEEARIAAEKAEAERLERERREAELAERERKVREAEEAQRQREETARREREDEARREQQAKDEAARAEREAAERERLKQEATAQAEADRVAFEQRAEEEKRAAVEAARREEQEAARRREEEARLAKAAEEARLRRIEQDKAHRQSVQCTIIDALTSNGLAEKVAREVTALIAGDRIPHLTIDYTSEPILADKAEAAA